MISNSIMQTLISELIPHKNINYFANYFTRLHQIISRHRFWSFAVWGIFTLYLILALQIAHFLYLYFNNPGSTGQQFAHYDIFRLVNARPEYYLLTSVMLLMVAYCVHLLYFCPHNRVFFLIQKIIIFKCRSWFLRAKNRKGVPICQYFTCYTLLLSAAVQNFNFTTGNKSFLFFATFFTDF